MLPVDEVLPPKAPYPAFYEHFLCEIFACTLDLARFDQLEEPICFETGTRHACCSLPLIDEAHTSSGIHIEGLKAPAS
jgi:hypothetical protein